MFRAFFLILTLPLRLVVYAYFRLRALHRPFILELWLRAEYSEAPLVHGIWSYLKPTKDRFYFIALELAAALSALERGMLRVKELRVIIEQNNLGWAQAWEIRSLLKQFADRGTPVSVYLLTEERSALYMASAAQKIYAPEAMSFDRAPFTQEAFYLKSMLSKIGVRPQFISVGDFKSAGDIFTRQSMSPAERKQSETLIADFEKEYVSALAEKSAEFAKRSTKHFSYTAAEAKRAGFLSEILSFSEFRELSEKDVKVKVVDLYSANQIIRRKNFKLLPLRRPLCVALVVVEGNIVETAESRPGSINWPDYQQVSEAIAEDAYAGVVFRINSPGGSALVSQLLWREWMHALGRLDAETADKAESPPVYVSQANVAASGGYYLSALQGKIFATPLTITGSIGVVGGKFNVEPLLRKLGINIDRAPKKNGAPALSPFADFSTEQAAQIKDSMLSIYDQFLRDMGTGRNMKSEDIKPHAGGRVFSGAAAERVGLVDSMGGISDAFAALRIDLKIGPCDPIEIIVLPGVKESLWTRSLLPFGMRHVVGLADFARPGVYALDPRFLI